MNSIVTTDRLQTDPAPVPVPQEFRIRWSLEPFAATGVFDAWLDLGSEMQSFYADRIRAEVETQHEILHSRSPAELARIQAAFFRRAVSDYRAHLGRMTEMLEQIWFPQQGTRDQPKT
ncbi:phasin family protein [Salipiger bermudensis]|uniref:phasin family protein n=1 Tax=Salipiger bermudensis TaxID=344736 RepID=UPI0021BD1C38|nr:phasin family protein [Salipiger bermudensis]